MADPTREAAFDLLTAVLDRRRSLEEALDTLPAIDSRDRAAAHRLAATVLRRMGTLDAVLEPFLRKEPPEPVRHVLRLGAAGLLLLDTPRHAAVATAVGLARARGLTPFAGLVNAVLRRVADGGAATLADLDGPRLDTPAWLWASWGDKAREIALAHQREAPLDLTLKPGAQLSGGVQLCHRLAALSGRHSCRRTAGLRTRRFLGAGRRRCSAGQTARAASWRTCRRSLRGTRRQDGAARRGRGDGDRGRAGSGADGAPSREPAALAIGGRTGAGGRHRMDTCPAMRRCAVGRAVQCHRHDQASSGRAASQATARRAGIGGDAGQTAAGRRRLAASEVAG